MAQNDITKTPMWAAISGKLTVGTVCGYMVGNFAKQISDEVILYGGCAALLLGGLHWMKWITINWKQIDHDVLNIYNKAKDEAKANGFVEKAKAFFIRVAPLMGGFAGGFYAGFSMG